MLRTVDDADTKAWFQRIDVGKQDFSEASCPRCGASFHIGPVFDHDPRQCLACGIEIIEWNMTSFILLIDVETSPGLLKAMITYLADFQEPEAEMELMQAFRAFGAINW